MGYAPIGAIFQGFEPFLEAWIRVRIFLQMTSKNVWDMRLFEHFLEVLSLFLEAWIRIGTKVNGRIRNHRTGLKTKN
jgi:hypothetical protein